MANKPLTLPLAQEQPGPPFSIRFQLVFAQTGVPVRCPAFRVAPGMSVTVRTVSGPALNTAVCFVADYPEALGTVASESLPPGADVTLGLNIENTGDIWASGAAGDGLLVKVTQAAIG